MVVFVAQAVVGLALRMTAVLVVDVLTVLLVVVSVAVAMLNVLVAMSVCNLHIPEEIDMHIKI